MIIQLYWEFLRFFCWGSSHFSLLIHIGKATPKHTGREGICRLHRCMMIQLHACSPKFPCRLGLNPRNCLAKGRRMPSVLQPSIWLTMLGCNISHRPSQPCATFHAGCLAINLWKASRVELSNVRLCFSSWAALSPWHLKAIWWVERGSLNAELKMDQAYLHGDVKMKSRLIFSATYFVQYLTRMSLGDKRSSVMTDN